MATTMMMMTMLLLMLMLVLAWDWRRLSQRREWESSRYHPRPVTTQQRNRHK